MLLVVGESYHLSVNNHPSANICSVVLFPDSLVPWFREHILSVNHRWEGAEREGEERGHFGLFHFFNLVGDSFI